MFVTLSYDIFDMADSKNAKKATKIRNVCKKYLISIQKSVFIGNIDKTNFKEMINELKKCVPSDFDSIMITKTPNKNNTELEFLTNKKNIKNVI